MKAESGDVFRYHTRKEDEIYVVLETAVVPYGENVVIVMWANGEISDFNARYVNDENDTPL